jgi:hypothetical protein
MRGIVEGVLGKGFSRFLSKKRLSGLLEERDLSYEWFGSATWAEAATGGSPNADADRSGRRLPGW